MKSQVRMYIFISKQKESFFFLCYLDFSFVVVVFSFF